MKKLLKWSTIIVGGLIALLLIGIITLPFILPLEKIKDYATTKISETINREVKIEKVSFNIFSGIKLKNLSASNHKNFSKKSFVSADSIVLRYAFWPLFKRQVIIKEVRLVKPQILVEKNVGGEFNFSDLTERKNKKAAEGRRKEEKNKKSKKGKKEKEDFSIIVDTFSIKGGQIRYIDHGTKASSEIGNANLSISGFTLALLKPIDLKFSATATYQNKKIPLSLSSKIGLDLKNEKLSLPNLVLGLAGEKASISATVSKWKTAPAINFSITSNKLALDPLLAIFAAGTKPKTKKKAVRGALTKKINQSMAKISRQYRVNGKVKIKNLSIKGFNVNNLDLATTLSNKKVSLDIKDIALYEGNLSGQASVNLATPGLSYNVSNLKLKGFNATPFVNTMATTFLTSLPDYKDMVDKVYGRLDLSVDLKGRGVEPQDIFANAVGNGSFALTGGEIKRMKTLASIGKTLKSNSLQGDMKVKNLDANFHLDKRVISTKDLRLEDQDIKASFTGGANLGTLKWVPGNRLTIKASPTVSKNLPQELRFFKDEKGWFELTFEITGSLKKPIPKPILDKPLEKVIGKLKIKIEAAEVEIQKKANEELKKQEAAVKKKLEEEKKKAEEEAKKKLEEEAKKQLKNLIKF